MAELEFEPRPDFAAVGKAPPSGCPSRTCWYFSGEDPCVHGEHLYSLVCSLKELTLPGAGTLGREAGRVGVGERRVSPAGGGRSGLHPGWSALNFMTLD